MKRLSAVLLGGLLGILLAGAAVSAQSGGQTDSSNEKLVVALRLLNTQEYRYFHETGRFATREEIFTFLRSKSLLNQSPIDLGNPKPFDLAITTSADGMHYQITLQQPSDMADKTTWCKPAAFSDDRGVIFLGAAIDCEAPAR